MNIVIVNDKITKDDLKLADKIIAVENGYYELKKIGIKPDYLICDFDTIKFNEVKFDNIIKLSRHKDTSDSEEAIKFARSKYEDAIITCFQFNGGRTSHLLNQIILTIKYDVIFVYSDSKFVKLNKSNTFIKDLNYNYFSVFSFSNNYIKINHSKYNYSGNIHMNSTTKFISNEFSGNNKIEIEFNKEPSAIIIFDKDK